MKTITGKKAEALLRARSIRNNRLKTRLANSILSEISVLETKILSLCSTNGIDRLTEDAYNAIYECRLHMEQVLDELKPT